MIAQKPTIVLIPGAWHTADGFGDVVKQLEGHGYEAHALHLPTAGKDLACTPREDAAFIQETTRALAEEGKDIILVMHSYGGLPGSDSAKGLLKRDRKAEGKQGGITHLVYIAAFLLAEGQSLAECLPKELPDWVHVEGSVSTAARAQEIFYHDIPASRADELADKLVPHSAAMFTTPLTYAAYRHVSSTYLQCKQDRAIPLPLQQAMIDAVGEDLINTQICDSSHSPMLSMPETVVDVIRKAAGEL